MKPILDVLNGHTPSMPPVWMMRQAGRYLPEYMELRGKAGSFLDLVYNPDFAAEVTMQPIRRFGMDAAILFSDILVIPQALGQGLAFKAGEGPVLPPVRTSEDFQGFYDVDIHKTLSPIYQTIKNVRAMLRDEGYDQTALIGFAGAPWTVACYMVEGRGSRDFINTKRWAYADPDGFDALIDLVTQATADYLIAQADAGAEALKLFDSWAGILDEMLFERYVIGPAQKIMAAIRAKHPDIPVIGFPRGGGVMYPRYVTQTGVSAVALDQTLPADWAADHVQTLCPVQGNLEPFCLLAGGTALEKEVKRIKSVLGKGPFIFNLGHGIHKETPIAHVEKMLDVLRED